MLMADWLILLGICMTAAFIGCVVPRWMSKSTQPNINGDSNGSHSFLTDPLSDAPIPIWKTDRQGALVWNNEAYEALARQHVSSPDNVAQPIFPNPVESSVDTRFRAALYLREKKEPEWYEISSSIQNGEAVCYAQNVSALVGMEHSRSDFFQTMAATFAQLSTGLAIFDDDMRLHLFNPAFVDMTGLPVTFLSSRPDLASFFDRMRDTRSMPEPRDYTAWRQEIADLAKAASEGRFQETWSLPSGEIYQVSGQPHPGGAIAFLLEDISAEVSLARQFRSELEQCQSVLDALEEAICIVSAAGKLVYANQAYRKFWAVPDGQALRGTMFKTIRSGWTERAGGTLSDRFLDDMVLRAYQSTTFSGASNQRTECRTTRLPGGDVLIRFRTLDPILERNIIQPEPV